MENLAIIFTRNSTRLKCTAAITIWQNFPFRRWMLNLVKFVIQNYFFFCISFYITLSINALHDMRSIFMYFDSGIIQYAWNAFLIFVQRTYNQDSGKYSLLKMTALIKGIEPRIKESQNITNSTKSLEIIVTQT